MNEPFGLQYVKTSIAVTGHRPHRLWGYDYSHPNYTTLGRTFRDMLIEHNAKRAISGMALGVDTIFAMVALKLRDDNIIPDLQLECAIPCANHSSKWRVESIQMYNNILERADKITHVNTQPFSADLMQKRNEYMVDNCDVLIAVWDGEPKGGTANCVQYAREKGVHVKIINPKI